MILVLGFEPACAGVRGSARARCYPVLRRHFKPRPTHFGYNRRTGRPMQILHNRQIYDVCVVGWGAGGGMAARVLTEAGANVIMPEAGPMWDPVADSKMSAGPSDPPRRGGAIPERQFGEF